MHSTCYAQSSKLVQQYLNNTCFQGQSQLKHLKHRTLSVLKLCMPLYTLPKDNENILTFCGTWIRSTMFF